MKHVPQSLTRVFVGLAILGTTISTPALSFDASGLRVEATPFDGKLRSAGIFVSAAAQAPAPESPEALFRIARSFRYQKDAKDYWQTPEETQKRHSGDCEDMAVWLYKKLIENGRRDAKLVVGRKLFNNSTLHVWVTLSDDTGGLIILDPTAYNRLWKSSAMKAGSYTPLYSFSEAGSFRHSPAL